MRFANVRELSQNPSAFVDLREPVIITKRGKPVRALISMDEEELEDFILAQHFGLELEVDKALIFSSKGKNLSAEDMKAAFKKK